MKLGAVVDGADEIERHRRGHTAKLSAHGEDAKFYLAESSQIKRHKRRHLKVGTNENGSACGRWLSMGI